MRGEAEGGRRRRDGKGPPPRLERVSMVSGAHWERGGGPTSKIFKMFRQRRASLKK